MKENRNAQILIDSISCNLKCILLDILLWIIAYDLLNHFIFPSNKYRTIKYYSPCRSYGFDVSSLRLPFLLDSTH